MAFFLHAALSWNTLLHHFDLGPAWFQQKIQQKKQRTQSHLVPCTDDEPYRLPGIRRRTNYRLPVFGPLLLYGICPGLSFLLAWEKRKCEGGKVLASHHYGNVCSIAYRSIKIGRFSPIIILSSRNLLAFSPPFGGNTPFSPLPLWISFQRTYFFLFTPTWRPYSQSYQYIQYNFPRIPRLNSHS